MPLDYEPTEWVDDDLPALNAANLNHLEQGLKAASDAIDALFASPIVFTRAAHPLISGDVAWEQDGGDVVEEPMVLHESGLLKLYYSASWNTEGIGFATCADTDDPTDPANWTKYASNPVLGKGGSGYAGNMGAFSIFKLSGTYYLYGYQTGRSSHLKVSTSTDGISWTTPATAIANNSFGGFTGWANNCVWHDGSWHMLVEGNKTGNDFRVCYATSSDGLTWTVQFEVTTLKQSAYDECAAGCLVGPYSGRYGMFYHCTKHSPLGSDIFYAYTDDPTADNWTQVASPVFTHDGGTYETDQAADPWLVEVDGTTYMFYDGVDNTTPAGYVNLAVCEATLPVIVAGLV